MGDNHILAISRGTQHSSTHQSNDAAMFGMVCDGLRERGYQVEVISEDDLATHLESTTPRQIISMAQRPENTALLARLESEGTTIINSFESTLNTYRLFLALRLADEDRFARTRVLSSLVEEDVEEFEEEAFELIREALGEKFWLKRGDIHAAHPDDVLLVRNQDEFKDGLEGLRSRSVNSAIVQKHCEGDVVKFYGIADRRFFHAQYFDSGVPIEFSTEDLAGESERIAQVLGLTIYGGDAVLDPEGNFTFIDFNSWPSFGDVRDRAVPLMIETIVDQFREHQGKPNATEPIGGTEQG